MTCRHPTVALVRLSTGDVVRGICGDPECGEDVIVETREDGSTWRWLHPRWVQVTDEEVASEQIGELLSDKRSD